MKDFVPLFNWITSIPFIKGNSSVDITLREYKITFVLFLTTIDLSYPSDLTACHSFLVRLGYGRRLLRIWESLRSMRFRKVLILTWAKARFRDDFGEKAGILLKSWVGLFLKSQVILCSYRTVQNISEVQVHQFSGSVLYGGKIQTFFFYLDFC